MSTLNLDGRSSPAATTRSRISSSYPFRAAIAVLVVLLALGVQLSLGSALSEIGLVPNLALLIVVAAGLSHGRDFAAVLGFGLGLALDLGPASDHLAGRWALALVIVGYVVGTSGRGRLGSHPGRPVLLLLAAAASFVGTSVFALTGLLLRDPAVSVPDVLQVILTASLCDGLLGVLLLPIFIGVFDRLVPAQVN